MRDRITLFKPVRTITDTGETTLTYEDVGIVWAEVVQPKAGEVIRNQLTTTSKDYTVRIRYFDGLDESWRIEWENETLEISAVLTSPKRDMMEVIAHITL